MTYRDRRLAKAERLREWAAKREVKAEAAQEQADQISGRIPFGQPILVGHHSERRHRKDIERIQSGNRAAMDNAAKAAEFQSRAANIEAAAETAIYSDDPDAAERLQAKLDWLIAKRDAAKAANAEFRKKHEAELAGMTPYQRSHAVPYPSYALANFGGSITRARQRIALLTLKGAGGSPVTNQGGLVALDEAIPREKD